MTQADVAAFRLTPDLRFLFLHDAWESAFAGLCSGIRRGDPLLLLTGPFGVGKTLLLRRLESDLAREGVSVLYAAYPKLDLEELLAWCKGSAPTGRVVMLDDADRCSSDLLAQLAARLVSSPTEVGLQIVLAGGLQLAERLAAESPQLLDMVRIHARLEPLDSALAGAYIRHRLDVSGKPDVILAAEAASDVFRYSQGIPRLINHACARALLLAGTEQSVVSPEIAREAIEDYVANTSFGQTAAPHFVPQTDPAPAAAKADPTGHAPEPAPPIDLEVASQPDAAPELAEPPPISPPDRMDRSPAPAEAPAPADTSAVAVEPAEPELSIPMPPGAPRDTSAPPKKPAGVGVRRPNQRLRAIARRSDTAIHTEASSRPPKFAGFRPRRLVPPDPSVQGPPMHRVDALARAPRRWIRFIAIAALGTGLAASVVWMQPRLLDRVLATEFRVAAHAALAEVREAIREAAKIVQRAVDDLI